MNEQIMAPLWDNRASLPFTQDGSAGVVGSEQSKKRAGVSYHLNWNVPKQNSCTYSEVGIEGRQKKGWARKTWPT